MTDAPIRFRCLLAIAASLCFLNGAKALDPNRMMTQYVREQWSIDGGSAGGTVRAIAQTTDGYLWIGTDSGLVRFDGFEYHPVWLPFTGSASDVPVLGLTTDIEGSLLVRLQGVGILRQSHGVFESTSAEHGPPTGHVTAMWSEANGGVLLWDLLSGMLRFKGGRLTVVAPRNSLPGSSVVISMAETPEGRIWTGTLGNGLSYLMNGRVTNIAAGWPYRKINCLMPVDVNDVWVGTDSGLYRWNGSAMSRVALPSGLENVQVLTILRDRDFNIWAGTAKGLLRINRGGISFSDEKDLRGDGGINALFEDREGNIWAGGALGLERIRDSAFVTYSRATGLPSERNGPVYVDAANRTWFAPTEGGLYLLRNGQAEAVTIAGLQNDVVYSITGQRGEIWIGRRRGGLTRLRYENGAVSSQTYTEANGLAQNSVFSVYQARDGTVWAGTLNRGVSRFKDGRFITYTTENGLASNTINSIVETRDGVAWFATPNGLSSFSANRWRIYSSRDGLPASSVNCLFEDSLGALWVGTSNGLAAFSSGRIQVLPGLPNALSKQILGLAEDRQGWLWIAAANYVLRVPRDKLLRGTLKEDDIFESGVADGLRSTEGVNRDRSVVEDALGRIWFSMSSGLSVVNPSHLVYDALPTLVHLEGISSDGSPIDIGGPIRVPPAQKRITFRYTGLSLAIPERIRFRYVLDGFDRNWSEPTAAREAVYTNLSPGSYRLRLIASNSDGIWNRSEVVIPFQVDPAYWQTWWFRISCVLMLGLSVLTLFRLRMVSLTRQMSIRMEERVNERTRIARDLHDSLLQGLQGLMFRLQAVHDLLPDHPIDARQALESALDRGDDVIAEGRGTVEDLRSSNRVVNNDLLHALSSLGEELAPSANGHQATGFRVLVEGKQRSIDPILRDEIYRIAREGLRNAFRHAEAQSVEAELTFADSRLILRIRDDGKGIDPRYIKEGRRAGHWGLPGMRERAERLGGRLEVWSQHGAGTEVELTVPAVVAYGASSKRNRSWFFRRNRSDETHEHQS